MISSIERFLFALVQVYTLLIIVYVISSMLQLPYNLWVGRFRTFLHDTVEPYLRIFRRMIPPIGMFDFSPIIAIIVLQLSLQIVVTVLDSLR
ncbi:MAG: YggT family protein [Gaiellales bacterium]